VEPAEPVAEILGQEWGAIAALLEGLDPGDWDEPTECPGWTVRDVVSHMIGTERSLLGDPPPPRPSPPPGHVRNEVGAGNEAWVAARRGRRGPEVAAEFVAVTDRRRAQMGSWPPERFAEVGASPVGVVPYREFMNVRVMDCWVHEQDIRVATARCVDDDGEPARLSLDRLVSGLPFVVGKQAGAPDGSWVRFDVRGPLGRRIDVVVRDGRAALVDGAWDPGPGAGAGGAPDVVLDMDALALVRLTCGRVDGDVARRDGLVTAAGDLELGERVLGAMAFMI